MRNPVDFQFDIPIEKRPSDLHLAEKIHPDAWAWAKNATSPRIGAAGSVRAFIIHATAGSSTHGAISVMAEGRASFHWVVPDEDEPEHGRFIWATAPEARAAWHVRYGCAHDDVCRGEKGLNQFSLGVELVNAQSGGDRFSNWQIEATAALVRYAWAKYPNLRHVVSHARLDPARRSDPGANFPWEEFEQLVLNPPCQGER